MVLLPTIEHLLNVIAASCPISQTIVAGRLQTDLQVLRGSRV